MKDNSRFWLAAALAPLSVPAYFVLETALVDGGNFNTNQFFLAIGFSYGGFLLIGLPFALFLQSKGKLTIIWILVGALLAGPLYLALLDVVFFGQSLNWRIIRSDTTPYFVFWSVMVAAVFGLIAKVRVN